MRLYLVRHGESQGNAERRLQSHAEFPLTALGRRQAEALAERLAGEDIGAVYTSTLTRAVETAAIVSMMLGLEAQPEPRLMEYDLGPEISGLTWREIEDKYPQIAEALGDDEPDGPRYPGEEGKTAFDTRVCDSMDEIIARHDRGSTVAVITHGGPIVAYLMRSLGQTSSAAPRMRIDNASLTTVELGEPGAFAAFVLASLNDTCHLNGLDAEQPADLDLVAQTAASDEAAG